MSKKLCKGYSNLEFKHGAFYYVHKRDSEGKRHWERLSEHFEEAVKQWGIIRAGHIRPTGLVSDGIKLYRRDGMHNLSNEERKTRLRYLDHLENAFKGCKFTQLRTFHVQAVVDAEPRANTANKLFTTFSAVVTYSMRKGIANIPENPCRYVERREIPPDDYVPPKKDVQAFFDMAGPVVAQTTRLFVLSGLSLADALSIERDGLLDAGIQYKRSKTRKHANKRKNIIEWNDDLRDCINKLLDLRPNKFTRHVICSSKGTPYTPSGFKSAWQRTQKEAFKKGKISKRFTLRHMRAFAATVGYEQGNDVNALLDHATEKQTSIYIRSKLPKKVTANRDILKSQPGE